MMVTSSRHSQMGPLTSSADSPNSHLSDHHPADLSPRSSNSSLISSNESLLNTSLSAASPGVKDNGSPPRRAGQGDASPLECLQIAFERKSPFSMFHESENDHLEQQIKSFGSMGSPLNDDDGRDHEDMTEVDELLGSPTGSPSITSNGLNAANTIFQCPLCAVVCSSRHDFNEHLVTHSQQHACPKCSFITNIEEEFRDHVQEVHGVDDFMEILSDDEVKTPKTNAQGKLKTFKCKHCEYRAVTKKEFWDHTKSHIREDKMLHCPKCPFITEYKHHLEYHLRNHMGSKPYQCTKCPYSCVNKSMLNSHLKSHSNVYQYRCSDCSYATKYCHSLKLHLRKYNHAPAMVLNPDGTPNPLPIIDVYGTRRGPKIKRPDPLLEGLATTSPAFPNNSPNGSGKPSKSQKKGNSTPAKREKAEKGRHFANARDVSPKLASSPRCISSMPNQAHTPPLKKMKDDSSGGDSDSDIRLQSFNSHFQNNGRATHLPQAPISPSSIAMILQQNNNGLNEKQQTNNLPLCSPPSSLHLYSSLVNQYLMNPALSNANDPQIMNNKFLAQLLQSNALYAQLQQQQQQLSNGIRSADFGNLMSSSQFALDLRNPKMDGVKNHIGGGNEEGKRRKRKGKALRYERRYDSDEDCDEDEALDFSNNNNIEYKENKDKMRRNDTPTDLSLSPNNMQCKYCEISFPDRELYTIHMNFHSGDADPFLCRSCGKKTRDKIDFFRHLTTDPH